VLLGVLLLFVVRKAYSAQRVLRDDFDPSGRSELTRLTFTERSPLSNFGEMAKRPALKGFDRGAEQVDYKIGDESFSAFIPKTYKAGVPHGLFVFISAGPAVLTPGWGGVCARHKLIFVCPDNAGNDRDARVRMALALDAVHNMKARYAIDERRVFLGGFSGGASAASWLISGFDNVFRGGGVFMGGGMFYDYCTDERTRRITATLLGPARGGDFANSVRKDLPVVLLVGVNDKLARDLHRASYEGLTLDGFPRATLLEVPQMGHTHPPAPWFEKAVAALDRPHKLASKPSTQPGATTRGLSATAQAAQANRLVATGKRQLSREQFESARSYFQRVIDDYPATPSAATARAMLDKLTDAAARRP
jgi:predicted esterase